MVNFGEFAAWAGPRLGLELGGARPGFLGFGFTQVLGDLGPDWKPEFRDFHLETLYKDLLENDS